MTKEKHISFFASKLLSIRGKLQISAAARGTAHSFEKRGIRLSLFQSIRDYALNIKNEPSFWSMGCISALVIGNHEIIRKECRWGLVDPLDTLTFWHQCSLIEVLRLRYRDESRIHPQLQLCYDECVGERANLFISFAYADNFIDLVDALESFLHTSSEFTVDTAFFWFDMFVNDQWHALEKSFDWWATTFREAVQDIGKTVCFLSPWNDPFMLTRVWCLYEISCSSSLYIAICPKEIDSLYACLRGSTGALINSLCKIDVEKATSYLPEDKERIFAVVRSLDDGFHGVNKKIMSLLRQWVVDSTRLLEPENGVNDEEEDIQVMKKQLRDMFAKGSVLFEQGQQDEAANVWRRALSVCERRLHSYDTVVLSIQSGLAGICQSEGKSSEAEALLKRCLEGYEHPVNSDRLGAVYTMNSLANVYQGTDQLDLSMLYYERALIALEAMVEKDHSTELVIRGNMAECLNYQGNIDEAITCFENVLRDYEVYSLGLECIEALDAMGNLALAYKASNRKEEARCMMEKVLKGYEKVLGEDHAKTLGIVMNLGNISIPIVARSYYERGMAGFRRTLGDNHQETVQARSCWAYLLMMEGEYAEARLVYEEVLGKQRIVLGEQHSKTLATMESYGYVLAMLGENESACDMYSAAVSGFEKSYGRDHPQTLDAVSRLGYHYQAMGLDEEANNLFDKFGM
jgi:tetratricopeptide (TPR) repeat protein